MGERWRNCSAVVVSPSLRNSSMTRASSRVSHKMIAATTEQAGNPDESGTSSQPIGNASHDMGTPAQVCSRQMMTMGYGEESITHKHTQKGVFPMSTEDNKATDRRSTEEGWNQGNTAVFDEVFAADFLGHDPS